MCLGALLQRKTAAGLYMLLFWGKEDIVLEKGREKNNFVIDFYSKVSCKESQALLQIYFGGMKFIK